MKRQLFSTLFVAVCSCTVIGSTAYGQDVKIDGKNFTVSSKTRLNAETEYFQLKEKSVKGAGNQSYIKTKDGFKKTVFTENEFKIFLTKGTISSLGKISVMEVYKNRKVKYISKGNTSILFAINNGQLRVIEYFGDVKVLFISNSDGAGGGASPDRIGCGRGCLKDMAQCYDDLGPQGDGWEDDPCFRGFIECICACDEYFPINSNSSTYVVKTAGLSIKFE